MTLEEAIAQLISIHNQTQLVANSEVYKVAIEIGHPNLTTDLNDVQHYLNSAITRLKELQDE